MAFASSQHGVVSHGRYVGLHRGGQVGEHTPDFDEDIWYGVAGLHIDDLGIDE